MKKRVDSFPLNRSRELRQGDRVMIRGDHPWRGHTGVIEGPMFTMIGQMWRVKLDNGMHAGSRTYNMEKV